jgi:hypothetical protein
MARQLGASSALTAVGFEAPTAKLRALAWASVFGDPSRMVDLAWAAAHRRGCELNMTAKVSIFAGQNSPWNRHYIYGFLHRIVDGKDSNTFLV